MVIELQDLIGSVSRAAQAPLDQLEEAVVTAHHLGEVADELVNHFVDVCRTSGYSWAEIGTLLGVTRQAAQKRFAPVPAGPPSPPSPAYTRGAAETAHRGVREHHGKYRPLWSWLRDQRGDEVEATFAELESVLGFPLPPSSRRHQPHWHSYDGSAVVRAIIDAGWRAHNVDLAGEHLRFVRGRTAE